ncbi:Gfo/Idh/MocA family protein [uncultured Tateyamaria sp.]|uniref:Gfo/Idh/MocA family protein n=1 Tax=uncultured Tateyamaria sp. TaxID=455651 RepID=UPI002614C27E|nr:Gfo/Idh/MocA family oxidoreductase [uncultured Tateyamaria sp.]
MRVAFIGTSHVHTPDYLAVCHDLPWVETVGIACVDEKTRRHLPHSPPEFDRHQDLPPHDIAVVLTDIRSHDDVCAQLTAPAVFVEKPLALNGTRASSIAQSLKLAGTRADLGFFLRHSTAFKTLAEASQDANLGDIRFAHLAFAHPGLLDGWLQRWPAHLSQDRMGGGAFADLAVHLIDAARVILGPITATSCDLDRTHSASGACEKGFDTQGQATLVSDHGALIHVWASAAAPRVMLSMHLVCEHGEVRLEGGRVLRRHREKEETVLHDGPMPTPADGFRASLVALRDGKAPILDIDDAVRASRLMENILAKSDAPSIG